MYGLSLRNATIKKAMSKVLPSKIGFRGALIFFKILAVNHLEKTIFFSAYIY